MKKHYDISAQRVKYSCKKCSHEFWHLDYWFDYGYAELNCATCFTSYFVFNLDDRAWEVVAKVMKKRFPNHKVDLSLDSVDPKTDAFHREYESTCDPCACGGKLLFDMKLKCPQCGEVEVKAKKTGKKYKWNELKLKWVTHENWTAQKKESNR